jgi:hypothetical protein
VNLARNDPFLVHNGLAPGTPPDEEDAPPENVKPYSAQQEELQQPNVIE